MENVMNQFESYLFGLILTDGSVYLTTRNRGKITIEIQRSDIGLLEKIQQYIPESKVSTRKRNTNFKKDYESAIWSNHQLSFRTQMFNWGLPKHNKSIIGTTPNTDYSKSDFWRGVYDGNGSIGFTKQNEPFISLTTASKPLKNELCDLLLEQFNIHKNVNPNNRDHVYNIVLKNEDAIKFCNFLYNNATIYLQRKHNDYQQIRTWKRTKKRMKQQSWSPDEIKYIQTHTVIDSMKHLNRTEKSIKMKLWRLNKQSNNF